MISLLLLLIWFFWCVSVMGTVEFLLHRYPMHRPGYPFASGAFNRHAILHHHDRRNDLNIDQPVYYGVIGSLPIAVPLALFGFYVPALIMLVVAVTNCFVWTGMHRAMHDKGGNWVKRLPWYKCWEHHHMLHHEHPGKNFGTVFGPITDWIFGTLYRESKSC